uniref:GNAT family N-acetyltransferase n=1 Tax=Pseudomonas laurentiana TaxID=2364649 RepID=UPI0029C96EF6|nr:GNAT family N-acetyltransferase [Pseudomonas laurentiana]
MSNDPSQQKALAALCQGETEEHWIQALNDGTHVLIRSLQERDRQREFQFIRHLSPESRHSRFMGGFNRDDLTLLDQLMDLDGHNRIAYVALAHVNGELHEIGVSRYAAMPGHKHCECAVAVADDWQRRGLGTLLMQHLIQAARSNGFERMTSLDSANNYSMHRLAKKLGFSSRYDNGQFSELTHELDLSQ